MLPYSQKLSRKKTFINFMVHGMGATHKSFLHENLNIRMPHPPTLYTTYLAFYESFLREVLTFYQYVKGFSLPRKFPAIWIASRLGHSQLFFETRYVPQYFSTILGGLPLTDPKVAVRTCTFMYTCTTPDNNHYAYYTERCTCRHEWKEGGKTFKCFTAL